MGERKPMLRITVEDIDEGTTEVITIPAGEYFIVTTDPCHIASVQMYKSGQTVQLTIKDRKP